MTHEIWLSARDGYEVSNLGGVRSLPRKVFISSPVRGRYYREFPGVVLKPTVKAQTGYAQVRLGCDRGVLVHRLVALAFCPGYQAGLVVNHKNGIRHDNRVENLEWVTHSENLRHGWRVLKRPHPLVGKMGAQHPTSRAVVATCISTGVETRYECASDAVRLGFISSGISNCCHGKQRSHLGCTWRFDC